VAFGASSRSFLQEKSLQEGKADRITKQKNDNKAFFI
jgi:hypothetical protein